MTSNELAMAVGAHFGAMARGSQENARFVPQGEAGTGQEHPMDSCVGTLGLSDDVICIARGGGNPVQIAKLEPGERVLDIGSGCGIDCILAGHAVGANGRVIGIDISEDMIGLAERNRDKSAVANVEFILGRIEELPIADGSMDVVISNCAILLSADKQAVLRQVRRVLKPTGRFVACDIVTEGDIPDILRSNVVAMTTGLALPEGSTYVGAIDRNEYHALLQCSGFSDITMRVRHTWGAETLGTLDEASLRELGAGVDWSKISDDMRYCEVDITARVRPDWSIPDLQSTTVSNNS